MTDTGSRRIDARRDDGDARSVRGSLPRRVLGFYLDGFRRMTLGRTLWRVVLVKVAALLLLALVLLEGMRPDRGASDAERAARVMGVLTEGRSTPADEVSPCPSTPPSSSGRAPSSP